MTFDDFFQKATEPKLCPYPFQGKFAEARDLYQLVDVPTGLGKTAMAVLGWLWRRRHHPDKMVREATPRRLVYCLPMRVLVEQTRDNTVLWLHNLGLLDGEVLFEEKDGEKRPTSYTPDVRDPGKVAIHVLMGGEEQTDWAMWPEREMILIGTQDMLLSRALNRGYAASRARWPMEFGLLHNDCLWIFDEIQLMGSGLATTTQLEAFRHLLASKDGHSCHSVWMSATLDEKWLETVDFKDRLKNLRPESRLIFDFEKESASPGIPPKAKSALEDRWHATKPLKRAGATMGEGAALAREVYDAHKPGTRTIVVVNTVKRACELHQEISKRWGASDTQHLVLLHSRFRPQDRQARVAEALADPPSGGTIIVSTQVIEAGVDVSATTLFTELAPWASLVQRFGRCNRRGRREENKIAVVYWIDLPVKNTDVEKKRFPYELDDLRRSAEELAKLRDVGLKSLPDIKLRQFEHTHVIRRRDLIDLFDTTPDLVGNDIDIDRFVREVEETDVRVYWRDWNLKESRTPPADRLWRRVGRDELCAAPVGSKANPGFRQFAMRHKGKIWRWDFTNGKWAPTDNENTIYPGQTYLLHVSAGGYDRNQGWGLDHKETVCSLDPPAPRRRDDDEYDDDGLSMTNDFQRIDQHTNEVCKALASIIGSTRDLRLSDTEARVLAVAARWHDFGKAHAAFQVKIDDGQELADKDARGEPRYRRRRDGAWLKWAGGRVVAKAPGKRWDQQGKPVDSGYWTRGGKAKDGFRRHFRHELASALALLQRPYADLDRGNLSDEELNLVAYLIAAHHGKVRLSIRSLPKEAKPRDGGGRLMDGCRFARGVWDGDVLPETDLGGGIIAPEIKLSLEPMELGLCEEEPFEGQPSWVERMIRLRDSDALGPFRLAYLEALLRAADWRAS